MDRKKSNGGETYEDPWAALTNIFNDYAGNNYQNPCCEYGEGGIKLETAAPGYEFLHPFCKDINPSNHTRPIRDASWFQSKWDELKTGLTKVYANFVKSGNQDFENKHMEWAKFTQNDDIKLYSIAIFDAGPTGDFVKIGKLLPPEVQSDTGLIDDTNDYDDTSDSELDASRRVQSSRVFANIATTGNATDSSGSSSSSSAADGTTTSSKQHHKPLSTTANAK